LRLGRTDAQDDDDSTDSTVSECHTYYKRKDNHSNAPFSPSLV
jgi:glycosyltransferase involved in cell wall biosynthesis